MLHLDRKHVRPKSSFTAAGENIAWRLRRRIARTSRDVRLQSEVLKRKPDGSLKAYSTFLNFLLRFDLTCHRGCDEVSSRKWHPFKIKNTKS